MVYQSLCDNGINYKNTLCLNSSWTEFSFQDAQETVEELMEKMCALKKKDKNGCSDKKISFESSTEVYKHETDVHRFLDDFSPPNAGCDFAQGNVASDFLIQVSMIVVTIVWLLLGELFVWFLF